MKRLEVPEEEKGLRCTVPVFVPEDIEVEKKNREQFRSFPDYDSVRNFSLIATGYNKVAEAVDKKTIDGPVFLIYMGKLEHYTETHANFITSSVESEAMVEPSGRKIKIRIGTHIDYAIPRRSDYVEILNRLGIWQNRSVWWAREFFGTETDEKAKEKWLALIQALKTYDDEITAFDQTEGKIKDALKGRKWLSGFDLDVTSAIRSLNIKCKKRLTQERESVLDRLLKKAAMTAMTVRYGEVFSWKNFPRPPLIENPLPAIESKIRRIVGRPKGAVAIVNMDEEGEREGVIT